MATTTAALICPQGHGPGNQGTRFCTWCGTQLVPPLPPGQQPPVVPVQPPLQVSVQVAPVPQPQSIPSFQTQPVAVAQQFTPVQAPPATFVAPVPVPIIASACTLCGGEGARLNPQDEVCTQCGWLRPLYPGYQLDRAVFLWAQDGQAMSKLQKISALNTAVHYVSDRVGRPWIESTFNGIRLGPKQMPDVWKQAVLAARILGLAHLPDVYVSGGSMWDTFTFGSDKSSFIVLGTAILTNFTGDELLFILAREMGHCSAGHAVWKSVSRFLAGDTSHNGILSNGLLNAINPSKLIEGAVEIPLMAWSRQSEITADRAGLFAMGDEALARRVLLAWSLRSSRLLKQVNIEEWMKQEDASDDQLTRFSEMTTSASMYTTRRLRLLGQAAREANLMAWSQAIQPARRKAAPPPSPPPKPVAPPPAAAAARPAAPADSIRVVCSKCQTGMRIPFSVLRGKPVLNVRCPQCQNVTTLRPKPAAAPPISALAPNKATAPQPAPPGPGK